MHVFDLGVVALKLTQNHLLVFAVGELGLDLLEVVHDFGQLVRIGLLRLSLVQQLRSFVPQLVDFIIEHIKHGFEICVVELIHIDHVVVSVLADSAAEADARGAVLAEALDRLEPVLSAPVRLRIWRGANLVAFLSAHHFSSPSSLFSK